MTMIKYIRSWISQDSGSTSVEFSMIGVGFFLMMFGVLELGRMAWTSNVIDYAADEAARYAVLHDGASPSEVEEFARDTMKSLLVSPDDANITVENTSVSGIDFIEVSGSYNFSTVALSMFPSSFSSVTFQFMSRRPVYIYD